MKTYRNLWPELCSFKNLYFAWKDARRGKLSKQQVIEFDNNLEENLVALYDELSAGTYQPGEYTNFFIHERKRRKISAAPFRDRVVHHTFCNIVEPIFEPKFIHDSYACRRGKGTHKARNPFIGRFAMALVLRSGRNLLGPVVVARIGRL